MKNETYIRVIPRDLFNEAKLLKCVGKLCLLIHDNSNLPAKIEFEHDGNPFNIELLEEGSLTVTNIRFKIEGKEYLFKTTYNSKANYPFYLQTEEFEDREVFDEFGSFSPDFITFCNGLPE